ncbi:pyridoxal phosphate-dependent transferase [Podospora australis]|uniref:Pyridoxal phosphate-dependent transferase n=1 Tax=Podospora australis TaxID=1536484 RepID=A0AAN6WSX8_9PEZI|nr:pyridoxal phosphate-dependent transferase [Podospora australis]
MSTVVTITEAHVREDEAITITQEAPIFDSTQLFSERVRRWQPPAIASLEPLAEAPGMMNLIVGKPNPDCFPFSGMSINLKGVEEPIQLGDKDLQNAFQYALMPGGMPELRQWFEAFQAKLHKSGPTGTWGCGIGSGSQDLLYKAFQVFTDPGDSILVDTPAYSGVLGFLNADGHNLVEVPSDAEGLNSPELERILATWPHDKHRSPRVLYTVPTGSNPTGLTCSEKRRIEVLRLAKKYNFLIFEDDAYYFLDFSTTYPKPRSYLSLEKEITNQTGRVLRFDSLSKIVSAGMRIGFLTTSCLPALKAVNMITGNTNLQASSISQVIALSLFRKWGHGGFLQHAARTAEFYKHRRDLLLAAAERHLRGKAKWEAPQAGMFLWMELLLPEQEKDSFEVLRKYASQAGVLAVPGTAFLPRGGKSGFVRLSYSLLSDDEGVADEVCRRIGVLVDLAWGNCAVNGDGGL